MEQAYATEKNELPYVPALHIGGTVIRHDKRGGRGIRTDFWMNQPRPKGVSVDEWDAFEEAKWQRIFGKK